MQFTLAQIRDPEDPQNRISVAESWGVGLSWFAFLLSIGLLLHVFTRTTPQFPRAPGHLNKHEPETMSTSATSTFSATIAKPLPQESALELSLSPVLPTITSTITSTITNTITNTITSTISSTITNTITTPAQIPSSQAPSHPPSHPPSQPPAQVPSQAPSQVPSQIPSQPPPQAPSQVPSQAPSQVPAQVPSHPQSQTPSQAPSQTPAQIPSQPPTKAPTKAPSQMPSHPPYSCTSTASPPVAQSCSCCSTNSGPTDINSVVTLWADPPLLHVHIVAKDRCGAKVQTGQDIFMVTIRTPHIVTRIVATDHNNGTYTCSHALTGDPATFKVSVMLAFRVTNRQCDAEMERQHNLNPRGGDARFPLWTDSDRLFTDTMTWASHFEDLYQVLPGSPFSLSAHDMAKSWHFEPANDPRLFTGAFVELETCLKHKRCLGSSDYTGMLSVDANGQSRASVKDIWIWVPPSSHFYLFSEQDVSQCVRNKRFVFIGDSLVHSLFVELRNLTRSDPCRTEKCIPIVPTTISYLSRMPKTAGGFYSELVGSDRGKEIMSTEIEQADHVAIGFGLWDMLENDYLAYNRKKIPREQAVSGYQGNVTLLLDLANNKTWQWMLTTALQDERGDKLRSDLSMEYNRRAQRIANERGIPVFDYFQPTLSLVEFPQWWLDHVHWVGHRAANEHHHLRGGLMAGHQFIHLYLETICPHTPNP